MLLIHGPGMSSTTWRYNISHLSKYFSLYVLDLPLFGETSLFDSFHYSLDNCTETIYHLMPGLDIDRAHLVGISLGGHVAALLSLRYAEKVHRLILINAVGLQEATGSVQEYGNLHELRTLECQALLRRPVLIITGDVNPLVDLHAVSSIAARNPLAKCVIVPHAGPLAHEESPEVVNHHIVSFCVATPVNVLCG